MIKKNRFYSINFNFQQALKKEILENYDRLDTGERKFQHGIALGYVTIVIIKSFTK